MLQRDIRKQRAKWADDKSTSERGAWVSLPPRARVRLESAAVMNLIPVDGRNMLSGQDHDNIVLGSAPPSPEPSEPAQVPTSPPLPPLPPAEQSFGGAASYAAASSARQELPPLPHVESQTQPPPRETFASSLQQLSGEAAFLPRSTLERTTSITLHGANANPNPSLPPQATAMTRTISEDAELYIPGLMSTSLFVMLPDVSSQSLDSALTDRSPSRRPILSRPSSRSTCLLSTGRREISRVLDKVVHWSS